MVQVVTEGNGVDLLLAWLDVDGLDLVHAFVSLSVVLFELIQLEVLFVEAFDRLHGKHRNFKCLILVLHLLLSLPSLPIKTNIRDLRLPIRIPIPHFPRPIRHASPQHVGSNLLFLLILNCMGVTLIVISHVQVGVPLSQIGVTLESLLCLLLPVCVPFQVLLLLTETVLGLLTECLHLGQVFLVVLRNDWDAGCLPAPNLVERYRPHFA